MHAETGCLHWSLEVEAGIRSAVVVAPLPDGKLAAFFGDQSANVYAADANTGKLLWKVKVDDNDRAAITAAFQFYEGRLYVPVASREESQTNAIAGGTKYPCCKFRGSVLALDAASGRTIWKSYLIQEPSVVQRSAAGTEVWGPSGSGVWNTPVIDPNRQMIYFGTGNNYSPPATDNSDAIVAVDMRSGKVSWVYQLQANDIWNHNCMIPNRDPLVCPDADVPDIDYSASPVLVDLKGGRQVLIAANKGGNLAALDPERGKTIWSTDVFFKTGMVWGVAADAEQVYAAGGGMVAVNLNDGRIVWRTPAAPCGTRRPCNSGMPGAVSAIPGVAFAGSLDGKLRAYSTRDGKTIWEHDTIREYETVNGIKTQGGSMSNAGPTIVGGMLFMNAGYSHHGGVVPGNALLAFAPE